MKHSDDQELDDIAKNFDHTELNHINFTIEIGDLAVMVNNRYVPPTKARPYIKIVNPSQVYNTLIAFTLKQENSIFYYFFGDEATAIHLNFKSQSESVIKVLCLDLLAFENLEEYDSYSDYLFKNQNLKLITLGFIWNMIEYASKYKKDEAWFDYYSSNYSFTCSAISLKTFYKNFGDMKWNLMLPLIYIDRFNPKCAKQIKLLSSICACIGFPCIITCIEPTEEV